MKRWTSQLDTLRQQAQRGGALDTLRQQAQLIAARRDRNKPRPRPEAPPAPPSHVPAEQEEAPVHAAAAPAAAPRRSRVRRERTQQPQDILGKLLHNDQTSRQFAEQVWWKWRHFYLPAKQADLQRRRGAGPHGSDGRDE